MKRSALLTLILASLLCVSAVHAINFRPTGDVDGSGLFKVFNFTNVSSTYVCVNGDCRNAWPTVAGGNGSGNVTATNGTNKQLAFFFDGSTIQGDSNLQYVPVAGMGQYNFSGGSSGVTIFTMASSGRIAGEGGVFRVGGINKDIRLSTGAVGQTDVVTITNSGARVLIGSTLSNALKRLELTVGDQDGIYINSTLRGQIYIDSGNAGAGGQSTVNFRKNGTQWYQMGSDRFNNGSGTFFLFDNVNSKTVFYYDNQTQFIGLGNNVAPTATVDVSGAVKSTTLNVTSTSVFGGAVRVNANGNVLNIGDTTATNVSADFNQRMVIGYDATGGQGFVSSGTSKDLWIGYNGTTTSKGVLSIFVKRDNGYVGVATSSPTSILDVAGNASFTGPVVVNGKGVLDNSTVHAGDISGIYNALVIGAATVNASKLNTSNVGGAGQVLTYNSTGGLNWSTFAAGANTINNVTGINVNGTTSHTLQLNQSFGVTVLNATWTDLDTFNTTVEMRAAINNTAGAYNISVSCSNITGAASNLCTITSGGSSNASGNITSTNGTANYPAIFTNSTNIVADTLNVTYTKGWATTCRNAGTNVFTTMPNGSSQECSGLNESNITVTNLAIGAGTNGQCLQVNSSGGLSYGSCGSGSVSGVTQRLAYFNASGSVTNASFLYLNQTQGYLGIGTLTPGAPLDVNGIVQAGGQIIGFAGFNASAGSSYFQAATFNGNINVTAGTGWIGTGQICTTTNNLSGCGTSSASSNGSGNITGSGSAGAPAIWLNATHVIALKINASMLNTSNTGTSGQILSLNSTGGLTWVADQTGNGTSNVTASGGWTNTTTDTYTSLIAHINASNPTLRFDDTAATKNWSIALGTSGTLMNFVDANGATVCQLDNNANGLTCQNTILQSSYNGATALTVKGVAGQSVPVFQVQNSSGYATINMTADGTINATNITASRYFISGSTSGTVSLIAPATAGTNNVTVPAVTGTLPIILASSGTPSIATNSLTEVSLVQVKVPAGTMGANGRITFEVLYKFTGVNAAKQMRVRFSTTSGDTAGLQLYNIPSAAASLSHQTPLRFVFNNNSVSNQVFFDASTSGTGNSGNSVTSGTVNTSNDVWLNINGFVGNTGDTIQVVGYTVMLIPGY